MGKCNGVYADHSTIAALEESLFEPVHRRGFTEICCLGNLQVSGWQLGVSYTVVYVTIMVLKYSSAGLQYLLCGIVVMGEHFSVAFCVVPTSKRNVGGSAEFIPELQNGVH